MRRSSDIIQSIATLIHIFFSHLHICNFFFFLLSDSNNARRRKYSRQRNYIIKTSKCPLNLGKNIPITWYTYYWYSTTEVMLLNIHLFPSCVLSSFRWISPASSWLTKKVKFLFSWAFFQVIFLPMIPFFLPVVHMALMGSVYSTVIMSLERYLRLCKVKVSRSCLNVKYIHIWKMLSI